MGVGRVRRVDELKIESLKEFVVFSRYLSFTAAARHLYVSQPALSYRIAAMEKELGFTLVDRRDPIRLTPAGKAFLSDAQAIVEQYTSAVQRCRAFASSASGRMVIERPAGMPAASSKFEALLSSFVRAHEGADVVLTRSNGHTLSDVLLDGAADAGVVFDLSEFSNNLADDPNGFLAVELPRCEDSRLYALVPQTSYLSDREHLYARDLDGCRLAFQTDPRFAFGRQYVERALAERGAHISFADKTERDEVDFAWSIASDELVVSDAGIVSLLCAGGGLSSPTRVARPLEDDGLVVTPYLVYRADNRNPLLADFVSFAASMGRRMSKQNEGL